MKALVALCLIALTSAVTIRGINEITALSTNVAITTDFQTPLQAPVLATLTYPTSYDSSAASLAAFTFTGAATSTVNNTITGGTVTFVNGADSVVLGLTATLTNPNVPTAFTLGGTNYPKFLVSGNYVPTVQLTTATLQTYTVTATTALLAVAATPYVPPTIATYSVQSPQAGGCDADGCTGFVNGTATVATRTPPVASAEIYSFLRAPTAATGVRFVIYSALTNGHASFLTDGDSVFTVAGGFVNGQFVSKLTNLAGVTAVPQNQALSISAAINEIGGRATYFPESTFASLQSTLTFTSGSTDVLAPTCNAAIVGPLSVHTNTSAAAPVILAVSCSDENQGSGLWTSGVFYQLSVAGGQSSYGEINIDGLTQFDIAPYIQGTFSIIGVYAIDNAGNTVLYGGCGGLTGFDTICTGSSSASTLSVSLFALAALIIFAFSA